ncbi:GGDEF domain-containing protein [Kumtagia ephedrae]|jgi:diguanylate cyclase|uniref:diguanylate cyclase n=1 Tax=Kumtagia ephedrae TaxID=2116701 RepID=A0A2P7SH98_9HYPH|nr:GGDEF domain-containing protein [Mesorhizobium ephedrae]PSJ61869.1 GGDEF domain-containing protein [Mesorhizobium ephedrae]
MQPAVAPAERANDIALSVVTTMRQMGVVGLPRNYEIFYEALTGSRPELTLEVVALGNRPSQQELDRIGRKYFAHNHEQTIVETARETLARELESVARLLRAERVHIEKYGAILNETSDGLKNRHALSRELLQKIVGVMSSATSSTIDHGRQVAETLDEKSAELESVKSALEEYKILAETDPLTHIWNRRAFDRRIAEIYNDRTGILFGALVLADIDRFKAINDRFGHPAGDKIIRQVADILRGSLGTGMFVARTGGEEFAIIIEGVSEHATFDLADGLRAAIEQTHFLSPSSAACGPVTVSMGVCMASEADGPEDLYAKADRALYRSKISGRNRVTAFSTVRDRPLKSWMLYKRD